MPARKGGSYVMKNGAPTLKQRTKPASRKPKTGADSGKKAKPAKPNTAPSADVKKESDNADA
ncbi:hypothetical protein KZO83_07670 [Chromohalobacter sp. TMW 2.2308]|uniref:Uncharacterized protein n=1 Tax=Chromohalobacter moromii TaxID=2860329 RepID=A0A9X2X3X3_9GAMM|nr:hypothetical protein [Chromohalobacter moromii]MCK2042565.1 hypothetical protein [Chromohalobacter moromii]MCT8506138.1 hypothetical protein [Chromohalobacter moromii]